MKPWAALAALALITMMAWPARADAPSPAPQSSAANALSPSSPPPRPSPKRPVPDYRGRHESNHPAASAVLWVPRVILAPVYLATEYVIREPLSLAIAAAEKAELPRKVYDFFTWGPEHKAGLVPIGFFEFDFNPSVGVYVFWNDAIAKDNDWSLHTEAWPTDWYAVSLKESMRVDRERVLDFHVLGTHRPDRVFYGLGPESLQSSQSRFTQAVTEGGAALDWKYLRESHVKLMAGVRSVSLGPGTYGSEPSLQQEAAGGAFPIPYGYGARYTAEYNGVLASFDTRPSYDKSKSLPPPGSGARVEVEGEQGSDFVGSSGWIRYGAEVTGFVDLNQHQRVLSVSVITRFADPLGDKPIPFTELVSLGGDGPMRGYFVGRMRDRSAAVAALHYTWPIAPMIGGNIEAAVGNVFGEHLEGFRPELLRFSGDIGITTIAVSDYPIEAIVGFGSETFEHGGQIDSTRVMISVNHGF
ncbi:MAG: BamA/TamA family outer membrane protein [Polyangiaceae bacterium]